MDQGLYTRTINPQLTGRGHLRLRAKRAERSSSVCNVTGRTVAAQRMRVALVGTRWK